MSQKKLGSPRVNIAIVQLRQHDGDNQSLENRRWNWSSDTAQVSMCSSYDSRHPD